MRRIILMLSLSGIAAAAAIEPSPRTPVLLELFTSEGCSSCPPADELLTSLDRDQPVAGADLIVIGEHVDYWNQLGWIDQNSSQMFSARQTAYSERLHSGDIYTPQLLVDGRYPLVGSRRAAAESAIRSALDSPKFPIVLEPAKQGDNTQLHIAIQAAANRSPADVYIVLAREHATSKVTAGENSGKLLTHTAVAFSLRKVGSVDARAFDRDIHEPAGRSGPVRIIVFAQDRKTGRIVGVAQIKA